MCAAINRSLEQGVPLTDPKFYGKISEGELDQLFMGDDNVPCPMIKQRVHCLHEIAQVLEQSYSGAFYNALLKCGQSATKLVQIITQDFPCFNDRAMYKGKSVCFHKRAQILVADLWQLFEGQDVCHFDDIDDITMFADYRVPQSLQYFGVFEYSDELLEFLKGADHVMDNGDAREVEIRGCSIAAVERILQRVNDKLKDNKQKMNAIQLDNFLWSFRREKAQEMQLHHPYHRVRSIYY